MKRLSKSQNKVKYQFNMFNLTAIDNDNNMDLHNTF